MGNFLYDIFLVLYKTGFRLASLFNRKAKLGVLGRQNIFSTIGTAIPKTPEQLVWMHCASLGEFEQGRPLLESVRKTYPGVMIVLTFFSASGYEVMKNYKDADHVFYLPLDGAANAKRMVDALNPSLVLWVKYEFWFYYLHELKTRNIPLLLVSGIFRESHPFFKWYGGIWRKMLSCFTYFFVQNESSENLLATVGIRGNAMVTGDTRFDRVIEIAEKFEPLPSIEKFCAGHKVIVAGSTWEDDEAELIHYVRANPQVRFIIAPHETDADNLKDVKKEFTNAIFYSSISGKKDKESVPGNVLIIDNLGMLSRLYHYADIAYVGGGFGADGVHNVLEAAVYGKPVIYGPEYEKYSEAIGLVECGGGIPVKNALELETVLNDVWANPAEAAAKGMAAKNYVYSNAGASDKIIRFIQAKRLLTN